MKTFSGYLNSVESTRVSFGDQQEPVRVFRFEPRRRLVSKFVQIPDILHKVVCLVHGLVIPMMSASWRGIVPIRKGRDLAVKITRGMESIKAVAIPVNRIRCPGPEVTNTTRPFPSPWHIRRPHELQPAHAGLRPAGRGPLTRRKGKNGSTWIIENNFHPSFLDIRQ